MIHKGLYMSYQNPQSRCLLAALSSTAKQGGASNCWQNLDKKKKEYLIRNVAVTRQWDIKERRKLAQFRLWTLNSESFPSNTTVLLIGEAEKQVTGEAGEACQDRNKDVSTSSLSL